MDISIRNIDSSNWEECAQLEVAEEQKPFIAANLYSLAESRFLDGMKLFGIYRDEDMVGFASYILDEQGDMNLYKLMIDKKHQGKGYGKKALQLLMEMIKVETKKKEVWLSLHPNNHAAIKLYSDYGFRQVMTGMEDEDEVFFRYDIE